MPQRERGTIRGLNLPSGEAAIRPPEAVALAFGTDIHGPSAQNVVKKTGKTAGVIDIELSSVAAQVSPAATLKYRTCDTRK